MILDSAVQDAKAMQDFEVESLMMGADHSQMVKAAPIISDYGLRDCVDLASSTAEFRMMHNKFFPASAEQLHPFLNWLEQQLTHYSISTNSIQDCVLATEEVVMNVIQHGYQGMGGQIEVSLLVNQDGVTITIRDQARRVNPLLHRRSIDSSLSDVGGHGIRLIEGLMDKVVYTETEEGNMLTLFTFLNTMSK